MYIDQLIDDLKEELKDIRTAYRRVMNMCTIAFAIGVCLIGMSIILIFFCLT